MWIPHVNWNPRNKLVFSNKTKVQRIKKVNKSIEPENDLNKRRHQRIKSFSSILDMLL